VEKLAEEIKKIKKTMAEIRDDVDKADTKAGHAEDDVEDLTKIVSDMQEEIEEQKNKRIKIKKGGL
jgi:chromosome segregation ATPase